MARPALERRRMIGRPARSPAALRRARRSLGSAATSKSVAHAAFRVALVHVASFEDFDVARSKAQALGLPVWPLEVLLGKPPARPTPPCDRPGSFRPPSAETSPPGEGAWRWSASRS